MKKRQLDRVWRALSDPTRRRMLDLVAGTERTTGELAAHFPRLSRFAVMKHLSVLERAGLLIVRREGRKRRNLLNAVPLREVFARWVSQHEEIFADSLLKIREDAESSDGRN